MKKIFLIFILIVTSKGFYSQTTEKVTHSEIGCWNEKNSKWEWDSIQESELIITFDKSIISINNLLCSKYETSRGSSKYKNLVTWEATDENSIPCHVSLEFIDDYSILIILYDELCFRYYY